MIFELRKRLISHTLLWLVLVVSLVSCQSNANNIPIKIEYNGYIYENDGSFLSLDENISNYYIASGSKVSDQSKITGKEIFININNDNIIYVKYDDETPSKWIPYYKKSKSTDN